MVLALYSTSGFFYSSDAPCEISYQAVGCYSEDSSNRAFAEELLNQIDPADQKFNGVMMEYGDNWQREFAKFLCRCAREAHHKGYTMFGVREHGKKNSVENFKGAVCVLI